MGVSQECYSCLQQLCCKKGVEGATNTVQLSGGSNTNTQVSGVTSQLGVWLITVAGDLDPQPLYRLVDTIVGDACL